MGLLAAILIRPDLVRGEDATTDGSAAGTGKDGGSGEALKATGGVGAAEPVCGAGDRESDRDGLASSPVGTCEMLLALV